MILGHNSNRLSAGQQIVIHPDCFAVRVSSHVVPLSVYSLLICFYLFVGLVFKSGQLINELLPD